jgi:hypothetical protein
VEPAVTHAERRDELQQRIRRMNARMRHLQTQVEAADNDTRFHMQRHVQSVSELLVDVNMRVVAPPDEYETHRQLERDVAAAEDELEAAESKLDAVGAEARGHTAAAVRADLRAMAARGTALRDELSPRSPAEPDPTEGVTERTETLIAATYAFQLDAIDDLEDVRAAYASRGIGDVFETAVLSRRGDGKVHIAGSVEEPAGRPSGPGLVARGLRRGDLKDLGEVLGRGESALVVLAHADMASRAEAAITRGKIVLTGPVEFDAFGLRTDIGSLERIT